MNLQQEQQKVKQQTIPKYFYQTSDIFKTEIKHQICKVNVLKSNVDQEDRYFLAKLKSQEKKYKVYQINKDGQIMDDQFGIVQGYKPIHVLEEMTMLVKKDCEVALWRSGSGLGETIKLEFVPKHIVSLPMKNRFLLGSNKSIKQFVSVSLINNEKLVFKSMKLPFDLVDPNQQSKGYEIHHALSVDELLVFSVYNQITSVYSIFLFKFQLEQFIKTDTYRLKAGKILNSLTISHNSKGDGKDPQTMFMKLLIGYDCSKVMEVMLNSNETNHKFQRLFVKMRHTFNFSNINQLLKVQGTRDIIIQDRMTSYNHQEQSGKITMFRQEKYERKQFGQKVREFNGFTNNILMLDQDDCSNNLVIQNSKQIMVVTIIGTEMYIKNMFKITLLETMQHYLQDKQLNVALQMQQKYNLSSSLVLEFQLEADKYRNRKMLKQFLESQSGQEGFMKITEIIMYKQVDSTESLQAMLDFNQRYLVDKINQSEDAGEQQDKSFLRQILQYQKRLQLFLKLETMHHINIEWPKWQDDTNSCQKFVLLQDFIELCNIIFYECQVENEHGLSETQITSIFDEVLTTLMRLTYHEFALNYYRLIDVLPLEKLSWNVISQILPSPMAQDRSQFWINIQNIMSNTQNDEKSIVNDKELQEELYLKVLEELIELDQPEKALQVAKNAVETKGIVSEQIGRIAVQTIQILLHNQTRNIIYVTQIDLQLITFSAGNTNDDISEIAENIGKYLQKAKFIFHRNHKLYSEYLLQLRYYTSYILDPEYRQDFIALLISMQAQRELQFTFKDSELVQMMLELIYCPSFRPLSKTTSAFDDLPPLKYMMFTLPTVIYLHSNILPYLVESMGGDEILETSVNQQTFIENNLINHVKLGMMPTFQNIYFKYLEGKKDNVKDIKEDEGPLKQLKNGMIRFCDLLKIQNDENNDVSTNGYKFAIEMVKDVIEANIKKSSSKRETFKKHFTNISSIIGQTSNQLTKKTTNMLGLFQAQDSGTKESTSSMSQDQKWIDLHDEICELLKLLQYGSKDNIREIQELFIRRMLALGNFEALGQIMTDQQNSNSKIKIDGQMVNRCVLEDIRQNYDSILFKRKVNLDSETDELDKSQQITVYFNFYQQSVAFLKMLQQNSRNSDFTAECQKEIDLLELTKNLLLDDLLVWFIPTPQIRLDFDNKFVFKRLIQVHGIRELFLTKNDQIKSLSKYVSSKENKEVMVVFEILKHLQEIRMLQLHNQEVQFVVKMINNYLITQNFDMFHLRNSNNEGVQEIMFAIVTSCEDIENNNDIIQIIYYLLRYGDMISSKKFHDLCYVYSQVRKRMSSSDNIKDIENYEITTLQQALKMKQKYKCLNLLKKHISNLEMEKLKESPLKCIAQSIFDAGICLTYQETLFLLDLLSNYYIQLGFDSEIQYAAQKISSKLIVEKRGGLEFVISDGKGILAPSAAETLNNVESAKEYSIWNLQSKENDSQDDDIKLMDDYMNTNYKNTSNEDIVKIITNQSSITQDALSYSILYMFKRIDQQVDSQVITNIVANIYQVFDQSAINISNLLIFVLSFFNIVKLQIPVTQIKPASSLQKFTYEVLVACIPLKLLMLSLDIVELVSDSSFYCMIDTLTDIDDFLPESNDDYNISLHALFLICHHIKAKYMDVRYKQKSDIDIDLEEHFQDEDDEYAISVFSKVKYQIDQVLYNN